MSVRLGGAFQIGEQPYQVPLAGGAAYYIPEGNYTAVLGPYTALEFWDWQQQQWTVISGPQTYGTTGSYPMAFLTDGYNYRLRNVSGTVKSTSITGAGSAGTNGIGTAATGVTIGVTAAPSTGITASFFPIVGGQIGSSATITAAGSGLVAPPLLVVQPPPPGGIQATMTCVVTAGAVSAVTVVNQGAGYTAVPQVLVVPQLPSYAGATPPSPGTLPVLGTQDFGTLVTQWNPVFGAYFKNIGAFTTLPVITAGALAGSGTLTGIGIFLPGIGYTSAPTLTITGMTSATATASLWGGTLANDTSYLYPATQQ